jgi:Predicted membrane protein
MTPRHTEKTSTRFDANVAAALSYLVGFVTGIIFLVIEKENKFVRFHAMQSTLVFAGIVAVDILLQIVPILGALVVIFVVIPLSAILWLLLMFKAYQGQEFKLPLVGQMAADRT